MGTDRWGNGAGHGQLPMPDLWHEKMGNDRPIARIRYTHEQVHDIHGVRFVRSQGRRSKLRSEGGGSTTRMTGKKLTYKSRAAIALAASLGLITPQAINRGGLEMTEIIPKIREAGYIWDADKQQWRAKLHGGPARTPAGHDEVIEHTSTMDLYNAVRLILVGYPETLAWAIPRIESMIEVIDGKIVHQSRLRRKFTNPNHIGVTIHVDFQVNTEELEQWRKPNQPANNTTPGKRGKQPPKSAI
jgi:hypothetical protein